ncbi:MAG: hypothetical protein CR987_00340 [Draconibacterium sp.]|nr:MAG: hypothetical protein CR987_00340 [Draconibacterium sp.]
MIINSMNMKKACLVLLVIFPFWVVAQTNQTDSNGKKQGIWQKNYPNGKPIYIGQFKDDKPVGLWKRFYPGGQIKAKIQYSETSDTAFTVLYDVYRNKIAEGYYLNRQKTGTWKYFNKKRLVSEEEYQNGKKNGVSKLYYKNGKLLETTEWKDGKKNGKYQAYFKDGNPYFQCKYKNNLRDGLCLTSFKNGRTELKAYYNAGLRDKDWSFYKQDGKLLYTLKYRKGELLNPQVKDSIDKINNVELKENKAIKDPEKFLANPTEYLKK